MLPEKNLDEYSETIEYLFNDNSKKYDNSLIFILQHIIPGPFIKFPIALSYKRKLQIKDEPIPNRTFVIYFHNRMIQFFLPFSKNERKINQPNSKVRAASLPPLIDQNWYNKYGKPHMNIIELNQYKKIRDRSEEIRIRYLTAKQE